MFRQNAFISKNSLLLKVTTRGFEKCSICGITLKFGAAPLRARQTQLTAA